MDLRISEEAFDDIYPDAKPMLQDHWRELAVNQELRPLDVDEDFYRNAEEQGVLKFLGMRLEGKLIGYAAFVIRNNPHYKTWKMAVCDLYYVHPDYRKQGHGRQFFMSIYEWLKKESVQSIVVQDKNQKPHRDFFLSMGFKPLEQLYEMVI